MTDHFLGKISLVKVPARDPATSPEPRGDKATALTPAGRFADLLAQIGQSGTDDEASSPLHVHAPLKGRIPRHPAGFSTVPGPGTPGDDEAEANASGAFARIPQRDNPALRPARPRIDHGFDLEGRGDPELEDPFGATATRTGPRTPAADDEAARDERRAGLADMMPAPRRPVARDDEPDHGLDPLVLAFTTPMARHIARLDGTLPTDVESDFDEPTVEIRLPLSYPVPTPGLENIPLLDAFDEPPQSPRPDPFDIPQPDPHAPRASAADRGYDVAELDAMLFDLDAPRSVDGAMAGPPTMRAQAVADALTHLGAPGAMDLAKVLEAALVDAAQTSHDAAFTVELHQTHARITMPLEGKDPLELEVYVDQDRVRILASGSAADLLMKKTRELAGALADAGFSFDGWQQSDDGGAAQDHREDITERLSRRTRGGPAPTKNATASTTLTRGARSVLA